MPENPPPIAAPWADGEGSARIGIRARTFDRDACGYGEQLDNDARSEKIAAAIRAPSMPRLSIPIRHRTGSAPPPRSEVTIRVGAPRDVPPTEAHVNETTLMHTPQRPHRNRRHNRPRSPPPAASPAAPGKSGIPAAARNRTPPVNRLRFGHPCTTCEQQRAEPKHRAERGRSQHFSASCGRRLAVSRRGCCI